MSAFFYFLYVVSRLATNFAFVGDGQKLSIFGVIIWSLWLSLTSAADCSPTLIVTELRLTIEEANAIRQLVPPEAFNAARRQRRVTRRVPEIAVPDVRLRRQRVDAVLQFFSDLRGNMLQHMSMRFGS